MGKKAVLVIAEKVFRDEEYLVPKEVLEEAGIKVLTASTTREWAEGKLGARVRPDLLLGEVKTEEIDLLVFVGGGGAEQYFDDPVAHGLAKAMVSAGKPVAAICIAPVILARAGLLKGKRATVYIDGAGDLKEAGAVYTGKPVETDGLLITANGPEAAGDFGRELVACLHQD
ncbi:MAG TPA: DJ-1/PfpI family protein [Firmicutes bacterium]|nr:DJ-1/PfpI family protein [Bacillota bacterium]